MVTINATPFVSLVDEEVTIFIGGLQPRQRVTLRSFCYNDDNYMYESYAFYVSDARGRVKLSKHRAWTGGFYDGIEPMGLFWSLQESELNKRKYTRMAIKNVEKPFVVSIEVYKDWHDLEMLRTLKPLAKTEVERWYKAKNIKRIPVKLGKIRGTLFIPDGEGPFKPVIDMFGSAGGLMEFRASMLASRGFLSLSLAIFGYDDLPKTLETTKLEYFEEAVEFLQSHPMASVGGVGIVAVSYGAEIALCMAAYIPGVTCSVCINGTNFVETMLCSYKGFEVPTACSSIGDFVVKDNILYLGSYLHFPEIDDVKHKAYRSVPEFHKSNSSILFIGSGDDGCANMEFVHQLTKNIIKRSYGGAGSYQFLFYPEAGHLLELPNTPLTKCTYARLFGMPQYFGGQLKPHAKAQEHSWGEILRFLNDNITPLKYKAKL